MHWQENKTMLSSQMLPERPRGSFDCCLKILCAYMVKKNKIKQNRAKQFVISDKTKLNTASSLLGQQCC